MSLKVVTTGVSSSPAAAINALAVGMDSDFLAGQWISTELPLPPPQVCSVRSNQMLPSSVVNDLAIECGPVGELPEQ